MKQEPCTAQWALSRPGTVTIWVDEPSGELRPIALSDPTGDKKSMVQLGEGKYTGFFIEGVLYKGTINEEEGEWIAVCIDGRLRGLPLEHWKNLCLKKRDDLEILREDGSDFFDGTYT